MIEELNKLLDEVMSPHVVSYKFDKLAQAIKEQQLTITVVPCKSYYNNNELQLLLERKNEFWDNKQYDKAANVHQQLKDQLKQLEGNEDTMLYYQPSRFERNENVIIGYLNMSRANQKLLKNLIEV